MVLRQHALGLVGGHHGQAKVLRDAPEHGGGAALNDASAGQEDGTFGIGQRGPDLGHGGGGGPGRLGQLHGAGLGNVGRVRLDVHGHADEHGPGRPPAASA